MAKRPVFVPKTDGPPFVESKIIEFKWYSGFSKLQARRSIKSLHVAAEKQGIFPVLEISGKSKSSFGKSLSAFNLFLDTPNGQSASVECAFQGSKEFEGRGACHDLYSVSSRAAKTDARLRNSGNVTGFNYFGKAFPNEPQTAFYDWLYVTALSQMEPSPLRNLKEYRGFTDIAFNPRLSINCQARSAALFVALNQGVQDFVQILGNWDSYIQTVYGTKEHASAEQTPRQLGLALGTTSDSNPSSSA